MTGLIESDVNNSDSDFLIYSTDFCPYCVAAKRFFKSNEYKFIEIDLSKDYEKRNLIVKETGHRTVPIIFDLRKDTLRFIGGFDDLMAEQS